MAGFVRFIARLLRGYCARICFVAAIGGESGQVRHGGKAHSGLRFAWDTQKSVGVLMDRTPTHYKLWIYAFVGLTFSAITQIATVSSISGRV